MAIVHILCAHSDYPTRIGTVIALQLSHRDCHIANVALKPSYHDCHIATDASHCTSRLSLNALHIAMVAWISSHSRPFSSICTSLSSNLHLRIPRPPGPPYNQDQCYDWDNAGHQNHTCTWASVKEVIMTSTVPRFSLLRGRVRG